MDPQKPPTSRIQPDMDAEGQVTVTAELVFGTISRAFKFRPKVDIDVKALSDRLRKSQIKIDRSDMEQINTLIAAMGGQHSDNTENVSEHHKSEHQQTGKRLERMSGNLETFSGAVEGQEVEPPQPPKGIRANVANLTSASTAFDLRRGDPEGDGEFVEIERYKLNLLFDAAAGHPEFERKANIVRRGILKSSYLPRHFEIIRGEPELALYELLETVKTNKLKCHLNETTEPDWDDETAWGIDDNPYGYAVEEGPMALFQSYLTWKARHNGKATFEEYKVSVEGARKRRYNRETDGSLN